MTSPLSKSQVYIAGICSLIVTVGIARFSYTPLLPIMQAETGLSEVGGGWLASANYIGYMLGVLLAASLNSLHKKYILQRLYLVLSVITSAAMAVTTDIYVWSFIRLIAGICASGGLIIASGLILKWLVNNDHRSELGVHFSGLGLSIFVSAVIVECLLQFSANWQQQWLAMAFIAVIFAIPAWFWLPHPEQHSANNTTPPADKPPTRLFIQLMLLAYFCAGYGYVVSATFIVDIIEGLPALEGRGPLAFIIIGLAATPAVLVWDKIARKFGYLKALLAAYLLKIAGILIPAMSDSLLMVVFSAVLFGATFVACVSLVLTMAGQFFPSNPAKFMGKMTLAYGGAQILAPYITGLLAEQLGNYNIGLFLSAFVVLIGALIIISLLMINNNPLPAKN